MSLSLVLPGLAVVLVAMAAGVPRWSIAPRTAVRVLTGIAAIAALTVVGVLVATGVGMLGGTAAGVTALEWCPRLTPHHRVGTVEGGVALIALVAIAVRVFGVVRGRPRAGGGSNGREIAVLRTEEPIAYALPGDPGCVVVSQGLLRSLDSEGRRVVFAHERAHLSQHHHRYLLIGAMAHAAVPLLGGLVERLRLATERCADEAAVAAVGGDRKAVATTIGRVALSALAPGPSVSAFGGGSIPVRVEALLGDRPWHRVATMMVAAACAGLLVAAAASLQAHHLYEVAAHVCSG